MLPRSSEVSDYMLVTSQMLLGSHANEQISHFLLVRPLVILTRQLRPILTCILLLLPNRHFFLQFLSYRISSVTWWFSSVFAEVVQGSESYLDSTGDELLQAPLLAVSQLSSSPRRLAEVKGGRNQVEATMPSEFILEVTCLAFSMLCANVHTL